MGFKAPSVWVPAAALQIAVALFVEAALSAGRGVRTPRIEDEEQQRCWFRVIAGTVHHISYRHALPHLPC